MGSVCYSKSAKEEDSGASGVFREGSLEEVVLLLTLKCRWVHSLRREGARQACSHLDQENWCCRNRAQGAIHTKLCASISKNTHPLFFSFPLGASSSHPPSYFLPSLIILSGNPWTHLLIPPGNLLPKGWVKLLLDSLLFRYRLAAAPKAPRPPQLSPFKCQLTGVSNAGLD